MPPLAQQAVPTSEITMAQLLKTRGYHTIFLGKWHLGETPQTAPNARGFDETLGFLAGAAMYLRRNDPQAENSYQDFDPIDKFLWANLSFAVINNGSRRFYPSEYMTDYLGDAAVNAIDETATAPSSCILHSTRRTRRCRRSSPITTRFRRSRIIGCEYTARWSVRLTATLDTCSTPFEKMGLSKTRWCFTSDNGGANYIGLPDINRPYRGWKATFFEGGIHVPFFVKWPAKIHPGTTDALPVAHVDIFRPRRQRPVR